MGLCDILGKKLKNISILKCRVCVHIYTHGHNVYKLPCMGVWQSSPRNTSAECHDQHIRPSYFHAMFITHLKLPPSLPGARTANTLSGSLPNLCSLFLIYWKQTDTPNTQWEADRRYKHRPQFPFTLVPDQTIYSEDLAQWAIKNRLRNVCIKDSKQRY